MAEWVLFSRIRDEIERLVEERLAIANLLFKGPLTVEQNRRYKELTEQTKALYIEGVHRLMHLRTAKT